MIDQTQTTSLLTTEPVTKEPILAHLQIGHTTIINDNQKFLTAMGYGIEAYCECDLDKKQMGAQELLDCSWRSC